MQPIEIRQKKTLIPVLAIFCVVQIGITYFAFYSGDLEKMPAIKVMYVIISAVFLFGLYFPIRKFIKNEPVLTISRSEITINEKSKAVSFLWMQVREWKIDIESDDDPYLIIETTEEIKRIKIAWLEKDHEEIEELIITYSGKAPRVKLPL
jgi:hypothetical protein